MVGTHQGKDSAVNSVPSWRRGRIGRVMRAQRLAALAIGVAVLGTALGCSDHGDDDAGPDVPSTDRSTTTTRPPDAPLPTVVPTPQQMHWLGPDVTVPRRVALVAGDGVDKPSRDLVVETLKRGGARTVGDSDDAALEVRAGLLDDPAVADVLQHTGAAPPADLPAEGYALAVVGAGDGDPARVVLAGVDSSGLYYAAQTLQQLLSGHVIAGVAVADRPSLPRRGVVEGFYGSPWTQAERLDQLSFYGRMKLNTYIYAPKADPYHRDAWRDPYPPAQLGELKALVAAAEAHHVRFTFAVSPGVSICYSSPGDVRALEAKLGALYDVGVRDFAIALDDIAYDRWNCAGDRSRYGASSGGSAAQAQVELLNNLQRGFVANHQGTRALTFVPTEYRNTKDSPYRQVLRQGLDPAILVMWTGDLVVPPEITTAQAAEAREVFGRPVLIWDNYPVNDYTRTAGRLLLGPYVRREPGLVDQVSGLIANPMNQAAASKVALVGVAELAWNAPVFDPGRAERDAAAYLAGSGADTARTIEALLAFFDLESYAPTSASSPGVVMQGQAPALAAKIAAFDAAWSAGDRAGAVKGLRPYAELLAAAPGTIRAGVGDAGFLADCMPWLDALTRWGQALVATLDGLQAQIDGDTATARARLAEADNLAAQARAVHTIPGETEPQGPVLVGDGVLDAFVARY